MADLSLTVLAVRPACGGARVQVDVSHSPDGGRQTLSLLTAYLKKTPRVGVLDAEESAALLELAALSEASDAAMRMLSAAGCSKRRLIEKLRAKGFALSVARQVVDELSARGYLGECDGALREAQRGVAKLWGNRRILASLTSKGYEGEALECASAYLAGEDAVARCVAYISRRHAGLPLADTACRCKVLAAAIRYGYTNNEIRHAMGILLREQGGEV